MGLDGRGGGVDSCMSVSCTRLTPGPNHKTKSDQNFGVAGWVQESLLIFA